jgi:hypothetical protein
MAELGMEFTGKRSQTSVAYLEAYFGHATLRGEHLPGAVHAQASKKAMRSLAKGGSKKTMEMKFGKTGLARRLSQQNAGMIFGGEKIAPATKPAKGVVMEKVRHQKIILLRALPGKAGPRLVMF